MITISKTGEEEEGGGGGGLYERFTMRLEIATNSDP